MEHETYGKEAAWVVVDGAGRLAVDHVRNGFDQEVKRKLEEYLHPEQPKEDRQEKIQQPDPAEQEKLQAKREEDNSDKPQLDNWQKYMENGEYLRSAEISEEQNYNMIDGRKNNGYKAPSATNSMPPKKKLKGRQSVLAKLHKKQAEIAQRSGKKERQQAAENDIERERK